MIGRPGLHAGSPIAPWEKEASTQLGTAVFEVMNKVRVVGTQYNFHYHSH